MGDATPQSKKNLLKEGMRSVSQNKLFTAIMVVALLLVGGALGYLINEEILGGEDNDGQIAEGYYQPEVNPKKFGTEIDNIYFPLTPGSMSVYNSTTDGQKVVVVVLNDTRIILGVECVVVRDTVSSGQSIVEDTLDWYAQDNDGNVWYFGEDTKEYDTNGKVVSTAGSWEAGVDGAKPGIIMLADPLAGLTYRQEYSRGNAEDMAMIMDLNMTITVPIGSFDQVLRTREWSALDPSVLEDKYYVAGIGCVLTLGVQGGQAREEMIEFVPN
jgi:hypothetical protein